jgi:hypothetical protein
MVATPSAAGGCNLIILAVGEVPGHILEQILREATL